MADPQPLVLAGLRAFLDEDGKFEVVGDARDGEAAIGIALGTAADVAVLDLGLPKVNGVDATRRIRAGAGEAPQVLVLIPHEATRYADAAIQAGAAACLCKDCDAEEFVTAVRACVGASVGATRRLAAVFAEEKRGESRGSFRRLTAREREVLQLVSEGWAIKEIAQQLHVSRKTIETHRRRVTEKLGICSIAGLTKYAIAEGLTTLDRQDPATAPSEQRAHHLPLMGAQN